MNNQLNNQLQTINCITLDNDNYPEQLKQIYDPPSLLYYRGQLQNNLKQPTLAVVGSRQYSDYGAWLAKTLVKDIANSGITIISGLAIGIDALSHQASLDVKGKTIAVLGSGISDNDIYPKSNQYLAKNILKQGGCIISEHSVKTKIHPWHFPRRNRIISGLSIGVLVLEAKLPSGSLITAKHALEQGREVMVVPGPINSQTSAGTNYLIKQGATPITSLEDVLNILNL